VLELSGQNLKWVTGGTNFIDVNAVWAWEDPDLVWFSFENNGDSPAYDVQIEIVDWDEHVRLDRILQQRRDSPSSLPLLENEAASTKFFNYPILYGSGPEFFRVKYSLQGRKDRSFGVQVNARNGERFYSFKLAKVEKQKVPWLIATRDSKVIMGVKGKPSETIPAGFPVDSNGKIDWDHGRSDSANDPISSTDDKHGKK